MAASRAEKPTADALKQSYEAGKDYALNGPNETNCHFRHFMAAEQTREWERGRDEAMRKQKRGLAGGRNEPRLG